MHVSSRDDGFTLIEALVAILVLGVIMLALGNVVIGYVKNSDATTARLAQSHDVQISTAYWAEDVASIGTRDSAVPPQLKQSVERNAAYNGGLYACGSTATGTNVTALVRFVWDDFSTSASTSTVTRVAYAVETDASSGETQLHRIVCSGSSAPADSVVVHNLTGTPGVDCDGNTTTCGSGSSVPNVVKLVLSVRAPHSVSTTTVTLTGQRRQT
jgi:prepilin-type N-terminal cleavage/methylation domain-containing protein